MAKELEKYLISRKSLAGLVLLTDIRHPLKFFDEQMLHWAKDGDLPVHCVINQSGQAQIWGSQNATQQTRNQLNKLKLPFSLQLFSAQNKQGLDELGAVLANWLQYDPNALTDIETPTDAE